ncbi:S8 family serine peptidase [Primorskyibacter sedentarius]|uniref:S8 family serine peptidase n=1 Tax=Primorskyibacter sedentarius TaxID=745311 RepID=UPI003EB84D44
MTLHWTKAESGQLWDAYLDWSQLLERRRSALLPPQEGVWYEPIFIRLNPSCAAGGIETRRQALLAIVNTVGGSLAMEPHELEVLCNRVNDPTRDAGLPDEYALYRRLDALGTPAERDDDLFAVLDVGSPVMLDDAPPSQMRDHAAAPAVPTCKYRPIVAIIDDGIGFLNARFRRQAEDGSQRTRFHAIWLQALETRRSEAEEAPAIRLGHVLEAAEIDSLLAKGHALEEQAAYAALHETLFPAGARRSCEFSQSHGTHVLDLAAGADPGTGDPVETWPLIGVQLPPEAIEDTTGTRFESYLVQGMRWILRQAAKVDPTAPVIINISLGILAGPKNGTRFAEYQIAREARYWESVTGQKVRVVYAFGNHYRSRQVASFDYPPEEPRIATDREIEWRVLPDDLTASYLEIGSGLDADLLEVSLTAPDGVSSGFAPLSEGCFRSLIRSDGAPVARIYRTPAHRLDDQTVCSSTYVLALAPTQTMLPGVPLAPSGGWTVGLRYKAPQAATVHLQIQRDDNSPGYRQGGRQSYFDAPDAYGWDDEAQDNGGLLPDCAITRTASHSALVTAANPGGGPGTARQVFTAAAAEDMPAMRDYRAAVYSAQGAGDWAVTAPVVATVAEDGRALAGVLATGTISGSTRAMGGTSAAAGRLSRALGHSAARLGQGDTHLSDLAVPIRALPQQDARLGHGVLIPDEGTRARRGDAGKPLSGTA